MHILGPSKNLNKENEGNGMITSNDNFAMINNGKHSGDVTKPREQRKL